MFFGYIDPGTGFTIVNLGGWLIAFLLGALGIFLLIFKIIFRFLKKHRKVVLIIFFIFSILTLIILEGNIIKKESEFKNKVIILGFDGFCAKFAERMMKEGKLPNLARLKDMGSYRRLSTTYPPLSPASWSAFATGQNPGKTGVYGFIGRDPKTYGLRLSITDINRNKPKRIIKNKCFWNYTSKEKIPAVIIGCPATFPPDKIYGRMLSGMGVPDVQGGIGTFTFYTTGPLNTNGYILGKVFHIKRSPVMILDFIGPKAATLTGKVKNLKVPFKVVLQEDNNSAIIEYQGNRFELKAGKLSDWKEVAFKVGLIKKLKGIVRFKLAEFEPEFKLYISPINFDPRDPFFQISYPKNYSRELANKIGLYYTQGMPVDSGVIINENVLTEKDLLEQMNEAFKGKKAIFDFEHNRLKSGILFCCFEFTDTIQHDFWHYIDPGHPLYKEDAPAEYKNQIEDWYKKMDKIVGSVLEKLNKQDLLIVLSDSGFATLRRIVHLNAWLRKNGYLELKNPDAREGAFEDIDWKKTRAYSLDLGAIYINQKGREKTGIVSPGNETESLKEELSQKLTGWIDNKYGMPVVYNVYKKEDIFWGDYLKNAPDIYLGFNIGYRPSFHTQLGAVPKGAVIVDNVWRFTGDHMADPVLIPGVLFLNKQIKKENPSIYDMAPTILRFIGFDDERLKQCNFDGESLF